MTGERKSKQNKHQDTSVARESDSTVQKATENREEVAGDLQTLLPSSLPLSIAVTENLTRKDNVRL